VSDTRRSRLKVSREGIVLIKSFEGFRPRAARDEDGRWTIGYGHTASAREGLTVGEQDAELLLQYDLLPVVKALNEEVPVPLNQHQFDALASFAVSVGVDRFLASDVLQRLKEGHVGKAADALFGWPQPPTPDTALRRRAAERALFMADPGATVHLADLLAALPPPRLAEAPPPMPDARAAAVAALLGEAMSTDEPAPAAAEGAQSTLGGTDFTASVSGEPVFAPAGRPSAHQRFSPYVALPPGPLPGLPPGTPTQSGLEGPWGSPTKPTGGETPESPPGLESVPPVSPETEPAPFPFAPVDEPLVLTPAEEGDFPEEDRQPWGPGQRSPSDPEAEDGRLFDEETSHPVLRHESEPVARPRFDWGETGAFLIMGAVGLGACAAAAASFRKAMADASVTGDFTIIGWVLALIGLTCVCVSSWNLYRRWGRGD